VEVLNMYLQSVKRAYLQAGLDPATSDRTCPGIKTEGGEFQVRLDQTADGEIVGSHYLLSSAEKDFVHEGDIFLYEGKCDLTEGRILTPKTNVMISGPLNTEATQILTAYINDHLAEGCFVAVDRKTILASSQ
jgi:hypothetical protein